MFKYEYETVSCDFGGWGQGEMSYPNLPKSESF